VDLRGFGAVCMIDIVLSRTLKGNAMASKYNLGDTVYFRGEQATVVNVVQSDRRPPWKRKKSVMDYDYKYAVTTTKGEHIPQVAEEHLSTQRN